jgi:hypothetical protein
MWRGLVIVALGLGSAAAYGQGVIADVLAGNLVKPEVGAWAWYDLNAPQGNGPERIRVGTARLAIVGEETVGARKGYWLEMEYVPTVGYKFVYKVLLTGPASDPANIHKVLRREGTEKAEEVPLSKDGGAAEADKANESSAGPPAAASKEPERTLLGEEDLATVGGKIHAQHFALKSDAEETEVWLNEEVRPMGVVKLKSADGDMVLRNHGVGGVDARSVMDEPAIKAGNGDTGVRVDVRVNKQPAGESPKKAKP